MIALRQYLFARLESFLNILESLLPKSTLKFLKGLSNSGLDTAALSRNVQSILRVDEIQMKEETAPPAQAKPHAKRKSQRLH